MWHTKSLPQTRLNSARIYALTKLTPLLLMRIHNRMYCSMMWICPFQVLLIMGALDFGLWKHEYICILSLMIYCEEDNIYTHACYPKLVYPFLIIFNKKKHSELTLFKVCFQVIKHFSLSQKLIKVSKLTLLNSLLYKTYVLNTSKQEQSEYKIKSRSL